MQIHRRTAGIPRAEQDMLSFGAKKAAKASTRVQPGIARKFFEHTISFRLLIITMKIYGR